MKPDYLVMGFYWATTASSLQMLFAKRREDDIEMHECNYLVLKFHGDHVSLIL